MTALDSAGWPWWRLAVASALWVSMVAVAAAFLVARVISHAKQTDTSGGDFIVALPYGTRHLALAAAVALLPPLVALIRKLATG